MLPELRISVDKIGEKQYKSRLTDMTNGQVVGTNIFTYDPELLVHIEAQDILEKGVPRHEFEPIRAGQTPGVSKTSGVSDPIVAFGQRLFGYLVGDRAAWEGFLRFNPAFQGQARLNIALDPQAAVLWSVPWEYLHDGSGFLALQGRWQIGRLPWALPEVAPGPAPLPVRVLVVIAIPGDQRELNVEREIELIQEALDEAQGRGVVKVDFLEFATLDDLREALTGQSYQVLHFTGHGSWNAAEQRSSLAFEDDEGQTDLVTPDKLCPLVVGKGLRLAVLSSCQGARTGSRDAFIGMGTALLQAGVPVVLAMQSSILDDSATEMARAFYTALGRGLSVEEALQQVRLALWQRPDSPKTDWGLPALYLRTHELRLIDPQARVEAKPELRLNVGGLPLPRGFVGRKEELRAIRRAVLGGGAEGRPYIYVWGLGGVGKTALAAKALAKLDPHLAGWAVVDCRREHLPLADVLSTLANFLRGRGLRETQLAEVLLDSRLSLADRVSILAQNTQHDRFLFVFDNLETQMRRESGNQEIRESGDRQPGSLATLPLSDPEWQEFFSAVFRQNWHCTWLFTSRFRLNLLDEVPQSNRLELHLPGLNRRQAIIFMNNLPRLSQEPLADKLAAFERIGGHPKTIELLEGWLAPPPQPSPVADRGGRRLRTLLDDPATATRLAEQWEGYFLGELLGRLTAGERQALEAVSVFQVPFWWQMVEWMMASPLTPFAPSPLSRAQARERGEGVGGSGVRLLSRFHDLSLVQLEGVDKDGDAWYTLHPVVREYLWRRLDEAERERLHLRAAAWYREQILGPYREQLTPRPTPETEQEDATYMLKQLASQTQDMELARWAVETGLLWRGHLFAARRWEEAGDIVTNLVPTLYRWGQRDLAKSLLRESIATREGGNKAVAQGNLATLLKDEGRLDEALATYEDAYRTFEELGNKANMAAALSNIGNVYMDNGDYDRAIERQQASLNIKRELGNEEGQAISLHRLSMLYRHKEDYAQALETSRQAEALARKVSSDYHLALTLHEQGIILNSMDQPAEAFARFQESLKIVRRIGYEAGISASLGEIGKLLRDAGKMQEAIHAFTEVLEIDRRLGNPREVGIDLELLGTVHEQQGQYAAALEKYEQALALFEQYSPPHVQPGREAIARVRAKMAGG